MDSLLVNLNHRDENFDRELVALDPGEELLQRECGAAIDRWRAQDRVRLARARLTVRKDGRVEAVEDAVEEERRRRGMNLLIRRLWSKHRVVRELAVDRPSRARLPFRPPAIGGVLAQQDLARRRVCRLALQHLHRALRQSIV